MLQKKRGKIINFSGGGANYSRPNFSAYGVSKAAIVRLTETLADELNPYFEPVRYHLGIKNSSESELNYQLAFFDAVYSKMFEDNSYLIYSKSSRLDVDGSVQKTDSLFLDITNKFFNDFKKYKYASFRHLSYQEKMKSILS